MDRDKVDSFLFFCTAYQQPNVPFNQFGGIEGGCELSLCPQSPKYLPVVLFHTYLDVVVQSGLGGLSVPYLKAFWSLWMQSAAKGWCFRDCRNLWTWGRRMLLGGKRPVHNHNSSQPFSSLYLHKKRPRREKKSLVAPQICLAQHSLMHLGQGEWTTLTWCGCLWAAWESGSRFHPLGVQLSRHLQIFGLSAHWLSGSFWMGSHPYISAQVGGRSQGWANWDIWWSPSVDDVVKDILHMTTAVAAKGYSGIKLCPQGCVDWSASTLIRAVAIQSRCTWQRVSWTKTEQH